MLNFINIYFLWKSVVIFQLIKNYRYPTTEDGSIFKNFIQVTDLLP